MKLLLDGVTSDTSGTQDTINSNNLALVDYNVVRAFGTFDGATVTLKFSADLGVTWGAVGTYTTFTDIDAGRFFLAGTSVLLRGDVTGAGGSTDVSLGIL